MENLLPNTDVSLSVEYVNFEEFYLVNDLYEVLYNNNWSWERTCCVVSVILD